MTDLPEPDEPTPDDPAPAEPIPHEPTPVLPGAAAGNQVTTFTYDAGGPQLGRHPDQAVPFVTFSHFASEEEIHALALAHFQHVFTYTYDGRATPLP